MELINIIHRQTPPEPWAEGEKIPWNEPCFSQRMLKEHLSQAHDAASRRFEIIERQVAWIHYHVLSETPTKILDLGCGPGFYTHRLARLGHECVGIDFSPASVAHARSHTRGERTPADGIKHYKEGDIRTAPYGEGYGLVMLIYGEFNVFRRSEAETIVRKAHDALTAGGFLLLEPHTFEGVRELGRAGRTWYSAESGLFSPEPHLCLEEGFWNADQQVAIQRYYVIEADSGSDKVTRYSASVQAYDEAGYREMLENSGFTDVAFYPSLTGTGREDANQSQLMAVIARKPTA